ncbi:MAG: winged helix-turn-helix domain-containing protein [Clostridia bacterium]|nr:winged helix-turn-helix domain-containing protein [Clostridia bacterium]
MIFCVEDDAGIRGMMVYTLKASGFEAEGFEEGVSLFEALTSRKPKLILLDIMLPGEDGISILKRLKRDALTRDIPVIMATAKGTEYDKVTGLDLGADDYLCKPFGMMEMVSRVKAVLRRTDRKEEGEILQRGDISLNDAEHIVLVGAKKVDLTLKEYKLLRLFLKHPDKVFSREELLSLVWGEEFFGETRTVDVHIGTLRTKLGGEGKIETVRGVGYKMGDKP